MDISISICFYDYYLPTLLFAGNLVESNKSFFLRHSLIDEYGIDVFHVRQAYQFIDGGIIADVAFQVRICIEIMPIALVFSIHVFTERTKLLLPAMF